MSDNPEQPPVPVEVPVEPAPVLPDPAPEPELPSAASGEPRLVGAFRFEAGEVGDLVNYIKQWVEWRLYQPSPAPDVPAVANDDASQNPPAA